MRTLGACPGDWHLIGPGRCVRENGAVAAVGRPIRLVVRDDELRRSRLTVFFRLFLAIPVLVWLMLRGIASFVVGFVNWIAVLLQGEVPDSLHDFVAGYVRYATQVSAYVFLAADPYPWFRVQPEYPVDVEIDPPERQGRWGGFFRIVLALPALVLASALGERPLLRALRRLVDARPRGASTRIWWGASAAGVAAVAAFLAWFYALARGRAPRGVRDLVAYALGYGAQALGYVLLLTGRYPSSDPALAEPYAELPRHTVQMVVTDGLGRSRLTVLFRLFLAIPHLVWLTLWSIAVLFAAIAAWFAALATGSVPQGLHRFLAAYVRYAVHVQAYVYVIGRRFPGFTGQPGTYGVDLEIDPPRPQSRWLTLFRFFLAVPGAAPRERARRRRSSSSPFLAWWHALVTRTATRGPPQPRRRPASATRSRRPRTCSCSPTGTRTPPRCSRPEARARAPEHSEPCGPLLGDAF